MNFQKYLNEYVEESANLWEEEKKRWKNISSWQLTPHNTLETCWKLWLISVAYSCESQCYEFICKHPIIGIIRFQFDETYQITKARNYTTVKDRENALFNFIIPILINEEFWYEYKIQDFTIMRGYY